MSLIKTIRMEVARALERAALIVRRGTVSSTGGSGFVQIEGFDEERGDDVEMWQHYGFASRPPAGAEILTVKVGADAENAIAVAEASRENRPTLADGEVTIYGSSSGGSQASVKINASGEVIGVPKTGQMVLLGNGTIGTTRAVITSVLSDHMAPFFSSMETAWSTYDGSAKLDADKLAWVAALIDALHILANDSNNSALWQSPNVRARGV